MVWHLQLCLVRLRALLRQPVSSPERPPNFAFIPNPDSLRDPIPTLDQLCPDPHQSYNQACAARTPHPQLRHFQ